MAKQPTPPEYSQARMARCSAEEVVFPPVPRYIFLFKGQMAFRVLLVDDHPVFRAGLKNLLTLPGLAICGEANNGKEALERVAALEPHLVLMDLSMPEMNGIEATRLIRQRSPKTRVILISLHDPTQMAALAKEAGADAYIAKTSSVEELIATVQSVLGMNRTDLGHRGATRHGKKITPLRTTRLVV